LRVLGYLVSTKSTGTIISAGKPNENPGVQTDSSWADDPYRRTSTLGIVIELGWKIEGASKLWIDNQAAIACIKNHDKSIADFAKHVDIAFHNTRTEYAKGNITPEHRKSEVLFTDVLTKPLSGSEHWTRCSATAGFSWRPNDHSSE